MVSSEITISENGTLIVEVRELDLSDTGIRTYTTLFQECFPESATYSEQYLRWQYTENPNGTAFGFDAWDGDKLAAHYAAIPQSYRYNGTTVPCVLSLNTATHPSYRNKGLFVKLARATYEAAARAGIFCVIGVANANSTPGFTKRLGFSLVSPLSARIGIQLGVVEGNAIFESIWDQRSIAWRMGSPRNPVHQDGTRFWAKTDHAFVVAITHREIEVSKRAPNRCPGKLQVFVGLIPAQAKFKGISMEIPRVLRPSPLNFIYLPLQKNNSVPKREEIRFDFLDFDAF